VANIIVKGVKDFKESEKTDILIKDFFREQLKWTGGIQ
jgi:hypothetical protein